MELGKYEAIIEAVLFACGNQVSIQTLCNILQIDKKTFDNIINAMIDKYKVANRGIEIIKVEECYQFRTCPEYFEYVKQLKDYKDKASLSQAPLEVLSIIAYKQPITKAEIEQIRGVGCYTSILRLMEYNLIEEVDRLNAPGRPILYGTTEEFLKNFGFSSINELPPLETFEKNIQIILNKNNDEEMP